MLSEISLNCSSQPSCSSLIAAIWKATLKGVSAQFLGKPEKMLANLFVRYRIERITQ